MDDGAIAKARAAFASALKGGDAGAASALYAEDATLLPPSAELVRGRQEIEAFWQAGLEAGIRQAELEPLELERWSGVACEIGRYELRLEPADGGTVIDRGKYLRVHERQKDGSWRWAVEMFNPDAPPASPAGRGTKDAKP